MALQRTQGSAPAQPSQPAPAAGGSAAPPRAAAALPAPAAPPVQGTPTTNGPALSTRETTSRPFVELGIMFGQALGGREPVMQAMTNLQSIGAEHGCDAIIAVKLMHYPTTAGPAVVAYGTGVRFLPTAQAAAPAPPQEQAPTPAAPVPEAGPAAGQ